MDEKGVSKYSVYLQYEQVSRWLKNLVRGSPITAGFTLRRLNRLFELLDTIFRNMIEDVEVRYSTKGVFK
jgi:hypothetical protein